MYLLLSPADITYLTGVSVHEVGEVLLIIQIKKEKLKKKNEGIVLCDPRTSALFDVERFEIIDTRAGWGEKLGNSTKLFTDPDFLTQTLREQLEEYGVALEMKPSPVAEQRIIKTPEEIVKLCASQKINRAVFEGIQSYLQIGVTEEMIVRRIQILQLELGASGPSFPPIVAFGENSAIPHHSPTLRKLQKDDIILIDMGVIYQGYCSDMTRCLTPMKNKQPQKKQSIQYKIQNKIDRETNNAIFEMYQLLQDVTNHIVSWAKPGMRMCELDAEARRMLGEYSQYFTHSLGHGVGLEIHESPRVSGKSDEVLREGMVITIEPGVYFAQNNKEEIIKKKEGLISSFSCHDTRIHDIHNPLNAEIQEQLYLPGSSDQVRGGRETGVSSLLPPKTDRLHGDDAEIYGLRYEEMVFVDKEKLVVL